MNEIPTLAGGNEMTNTLKIYNDPICDHDGFRPYG